MTIKTPVTVEGEGPMWALIDAEGFSVAEVYGLEQAEALMEAANLVFVPKLKPKAAVVIRKTAIVEPQACGKSTLIAMRSNRSANSPTRWSRKRRLK